MAVDLSGKRLALLKVAVPNLSRAAFVFDRRDEASQHIVSAYLNAAKPLGVSLRPVEIAAPDEIERAFSAIARDGADGVVTVSSSMMFNERARIGSSALAHKLPTEVPVAEMVKYGPLISYGGDFPDYFRRAAGYIDKILKVQSRLISPSSSPHASNCPSI
jgi:putative ABC transport system substrate-binding protein